MKNLLLGLVTIGLLFACGSESEDTTSGATTPANEPNTNPGDTTPSDSNANAVCAALADESAWTELNTTIDEDTTFTCDRVYVLSGLTFVTNGATLTVEALSLIHI